MSWEYFLSCKPWCRCSTIALTPYCRHVAIAPINLCLAIGLVSVFGDSLVRCDFFVSELRGCVRRTCATRSTPAISLIAFAYCPVSPLDPNPGSTRKYAGLCAQERPLYSSPRSQSFVPTLRQISHLKDSSRFVAVNSHATP